MDNLSLFRSSMKAQATPQTLHSYITQSDVVSIAVIGHTNTGKTSLMRTLLRDCDFGEVKNASATTRHVEIVTIFDRYDLPLVRLYDTPGLEDATGVMDFLHEHTNSRLDGIERLQEFLKAVKENSPALLGDFSQEAKVVSALLTVDIAIYVVDVREPVLSKYKDELAILASSGTPILPVFNFINAGSPYMNEWQQMLARRALHVVNAFDTVAFDFDAEMSLWVNLGTLSSAPVFELLHKERTDIWHEMIEEGSLIIADFLINVTSFSQRIGEHDDPAPVLSTMQHAVRQGFIVMQQRLLELYKFYHVDTNGELLLIQGGQKDIFDPDMWARYGIRAVGGSAVGMIIGAGIDVATLGASLGLGTAIGGVLGGILPNSMAIKDKAMGVKTLTISNETLTLLATQSQNLHYTLRHRGHASLDVIDIRSEVSLPWRAEKLPSPLKKARSYPHYSSLDNGIYDDGQTLRSELTERLAVILCEHIEQLPT